MLLLSFVRNPKFQVIVSLMQRHALFENSVTDANYYRVQIGDFSESQVINWEDEVAAPISFPVQPALSTTMLI